ncbi:MAG: HD domain-containing protein [Nitrospirae bacterium]|nr:HD domain-containing protein [Nitrospirota bacterium]
MADNDMHEGLSRVISQLTAAVLNTGLYSAIHPQVALYIEKAYVALSEILQSRPEITLLVIGNDLVAENRPIEASGAASYVTNFIRILKKQAIERITFAAGLPKEELRALIQELASSDTLSIRSTSFIKLGKVELRIKKLDEQQSSGGADAVPNAGLVSAPDVPPEVLQELLALTSEELDLLKDLYLRAKLHKKIDVRSVDDMVKGFIQGFRKEINPLGLLASLKSVNEYTFTHVTNVCILTMSLAENLGFTGEHLHQIGVASLLHDIGKIFIPDEILSKAGMLTPEERRTIETHTVKGARYLMGIEGIPKLAVLAALEHHQKFDGNGYPSIKGGWTPNITSQFISVADVFDAMRSRRSYQEPKPLELIVSVLMKGKGTSFNPMVVDRFLKMIAR